MTLQPTAKKAHQRPLELGSAIAVGAALAASVSLAVGLGVGAAFVVLALRKTERVPIREGLKLAAIALVVGFAVAAGISIIENWAEFKEGFAQGYRSR